MAVEQTDTPLKASPLQLKYADMLFYGCWGGLALMIVTYTLYVSGIMTPFVPLEKMTEYWKISCHDFLGQSGVVPGWWWVGQLARGDFLNFLGVAFLAGLTVICYIPLCLGYLKKKDMTFATIAFLEIVVLLLAASGIFGAGAH